MMLWMASFYPNEPWAQVQRGRCLQTLDGMWVPTGAAKASATSKSQQQPAHAGGTAEPIRGYFAR